MAIPNCKKSTSEINSNIVNGSASGSLRTINSKVESDSYIIGDSAFTSGKNTEASGTGSHAEGSMARAYGNYSHAEGYLSKSSGESSHSEGDSTVASGKKSHAEGNSTISSNNASHSEGSFTTASGQFSHAEGYHTTAKSESSHAEGNYTITNALAQHVQGKYNIEDIENKYAHIVGNGTSSTRSNAHTIDWNGNAWFSGNVKVGGTGQDDTNAKELATQEYVSETIIDKVPDIFSWDGKSSTDNPNNLILWQKIYDTAKEKTVMVYCAGSTSSNSASGIFLFNPSHIPTSTNYTYPTKTDTTKSNSASDAGGCILRNQGLCATLSISSGAITNVNKASNYMSTDYFLSLISSRNYEFTPTDDYHPATKKYVDDRISSISSSSSSGSEEFNSQYFVRDILLYEGNQISDGKNLTENYGITFEIFDKIKPGFVMYSAVGSNQKYYITPASVRWYRLIGNSWYECLQVFYVYNGEFKSFSICKGEQAVWYGTDLSTYEPDAGGVACFTADTLVNTDKGLKAISEIKKKDKVYSINSNNEIELKPVDKLVNHTVKGYYEIITDTDTIKASYSHPFYVEGKGKVRVIDLQYKDMIKDIDGSLHMIKEVNAIEEDTTVYEIRVKDNHNYFVGNDKVLVYNEDSILD